jgi:hypothetical protein
MADKEINTGGGTVVEKDVNTGSGDFIGRDKINSKTNILDGNSIVAIIAILVVGIIGIIVVSRDASTPITSPKVSTPLSTHTSLSMATPSIYYFI